ncbi:MAG: DoxX family membrane protein [Candidatus Aminicenantes bacterium]|nr:DoxX family membrane protein [Candidatus Aminicenantes bacterium]
MKILDFLKSKKVLTVAQLVLGGVFIYASIGKLINPEDFMKSIGNYKILPPIMVKMTAYLLPIIELVFGVFLVLNIRPKLAAIVLGGLLIIFIAAISFALIRGININCGCFIQSQMIEKVTAFDNIKAIIRDLLLLIPAVLIIKKSYRNKP